MSEKPNYVLTRDYLDNNRLNLHHYLITELFGYHIHPDIPVKDNNNLRIADVGTGTGVWVTDLARRLPTSVQLDALDISFDSAPPAEWLPSNVKTFKWDVKQEIPEELEGVYDIVHIRLFIFVLLDSEVQPVLERILKLLKPGGYIQWTEVDMGSTRTESANPANSTEALTKMIRLSEGRDERLRPRWVPSLASKMAAAGYENIKEDARDAPPHLALALHDCNIMIHETFARKFKNPQTAQVLNELIPEVEKETKEGSCLSHTRYTVVGRKPLAQ
ncbi:class I SAM-dependent methyltransferase [Aspergillus vadensis CBS 113365]|uniref:S-adenosyl-L-methionine-dependent methyltransferase n=1 Tax=Aspergillus vadensis (strain CBS 113365 / IMI 142717 / IBT 24658) TaxID=1448311 RepID=A0A319BE35_ASPVC|nr:S-adenosyl-L-methionine-dependent methyltransferase [Aspergillus vadensis CBS 113365]PYH70449.1 S-adenosyl-L-methionine-dependent methyltransferase [Aspergillus vadensis CBS 113365]